MGPPSSGGLTVGQILGMLAHYDISDPGAADTWRLIGDASRLAFADRDRYMADSDFVPMPEAGLIDPEYLAGRAALLRADTALSEAEPGRPGWDHAGLRADPVDVSRPSTSHISIVDADGNALSMTTTIENSFGSRVMVRGFLLNNELTDFSFRSHRDGMPVANRVEPGKRPRSSMSPTIVLRDGKPALVVGSPGGSRIIGYVAQVIIARLDWGKDVQQAVSMPHAVNRSGPYDLEAGTAMEGMKEALASRACGRRGRRARRIDEQGGVLDWRHPRDARQLGGDVHVRRRRNRGRQGTAGGSGGRRRDRPAAARGAGFERNAPLTAPVIRATKG